MKYEASCELEDNTNANAPGSGGFSGTIRLVQDLNEVSLQIYIFLTIFEVFTKMLNCLDEEIMQLTIVNEK